MEHQRRNSRYGSKKTGITSYRYHIQSRKGGANLKKEVFDKELLKKEIKDNVRTLYRKTLEEASQQEIFQAVSYAVKEVIINQWMETQHSMKKKDSKVVYYMSMEFLMGRALGNNLINLTAYQAVAEALEEMGLDINVIEDQEPDPASWKRRSRKACSLLYGILVDAWLCGVWLRHPVSLRYV